MKGRNNGERTSFVSLVLVLEDELQFVEELVEVLGDVVAADGVFLGEVVGVLPLVNVVVVVGVVHRAVVVVDPLAHLDVPEPDASSQPSQVVHSHIVGLEELQHSVGLGVGNGEDLGLADPGIVGPIGDGPGVVEGVRSVVDGVAHMIRSIKIMVPSEGPNHKYSLERQSIKIVEDALSLASSMSARLQHLVTRGETG